MDRYDEEYGTKKWKKYSRSRGWRGIEKNSPSEHRTRHPKAMKDQKSRRIKIVIPDWVITVIGIIDIVIIVLLHVEYVVLISLSTLLQ